MLKIFENNHKVLQPTKLSKYLSISILFLYLVSFGLLSYLPSALKGDLSPQDFTISQSLAFSIKPAFVVVFTITSFMFAYLIYYRGHNFIWSRLFLLLVIYSFIITILWVTTYYSKLDHYILASIIFVFVVFFVMLNSLVIYDGVKLHTKISTGILITLPILAIIGLIGLSISKVIFLSIDELFPSFENYMVAIKGASILTLGFI